jgi:hypothetical protein
MVGVEGVLLAGLGPGAWVLVWWVAVWLVWWWTILVWWWAGLRVLLMGELWAML